MVLHSRTPELAFHYITNSCASRPCRALWNISTEGHPLPECCRGIPGGLPSCITRSGDVIMAFETSYDHEAQHAIHTPTHALDQSPSPGPWEYPDAPDGCGLWGRSPVSPAIGCCLVNSCGHLLVAIVVQCRPPFLKVLRDFGQKLCLGREDPEERQRGAFL